MAKVFTTVPGLVVNVGGYGNASNDEGVSVPDEVAAQFEDEIRGFRVEEVDGKKVEVKFGRGPNTSLRVEREPASKKSAASKLSGQDLATAQPIAKAEK
jgi:hypothetical protein